MSDRQCRTRETLVGRHRPKTGGLIRRGILRRSAASAMSGVESWAKARDSDSVFMMRRCLHYAGFAKGGGWPSSLLVLFWSVLVAAVTILAKPTGLIFAAAPELLPVRIIAAIALVAVIVAFVHVVRHLKSIEQTIVKDDLVPTERGPRNNALLMVCAIPIIVVALLFYLVLKA